MRELRDLLGRWHQWRRAYTVERGYARLSLADRVPDPYDDDELEQMEMRELERIITSMPRLLQIALMHVGRAEHLGVEVMHHPALDNREARRALVERALAELKRRLP